MHVDLMNRRGFYSFFPIFREIILIRIDFDHTIGAGFDAFPMALAFLLINQDNTVWTFGDRGLRARVYTRGVIAMHAGIPNIGDMVQGFIFNLKDPVPPNAGTDAVFFLAGQYARHTPGTPV
jgi:hypothetical protein